MAYWSVKTVKGRRYVFVYYHRDGKTQQLKPRSLYKFLDAAPDHARDTYTVQVAAQYERTVKTPAHILFSDDTLSKRIAAYHEFLISNRKLARETAFKNESLLRRYVIPYFLSLEPPLKDPASWPGVSVRLLGWLQQCTYRRRNCEADIPLSTSTIRECNNALRSFWKWLAEEQLVPGTQLLLRYPPAEDGDDETPLAYAITPQDVLDFVARQRSLEIKALVLLGYFFSLRPQEVFALRPADFVAGSAAAELECCQAAQRAGLFGRLAVHVQRQRPAAGAPRAPKASSRGWVACFDKAAAGLIVDLLNARQDADEPLFAQLDNRKIYRLWEDGGIEGVALKDLRRASIYWLGHHSKLQGEPINLQKHARHKSLETTNLYLRRPKESAPRQSGKLDLGA